MTSKATSQDRGGGMQMLLLRLMGNEEERGGWEVREGQP